MELAKIFDSSLHKKRSRQERIEAFLDEVESVAKGGQSNFYDAYNARFENGRKTSASELICHHHDDPEVRVLYFHAAKRLMEAGQKYNAFGLSCLPEAIMKENLHSSFLEQSFLQIIHFMPDVMVNRIDGIHHTSTRPVMALDPFRKYEQTVERAEKWMAFFINRNAGINLRGALSTALNFDLHELPGADMNLSKNAGQFKGMRTASVSIQLPQNNNI